MAIFSWPKSTRGQIVAAAAHVAMLAGALAFAWTRNGPPPEKAFWAILTYFVEIAVFGVVERIVLAFKGSDREA
jgi:hypothetical protein